MKAFDRLTLVLPLVTILLIALSQALFGETAAARLLQLAVASAC